MVGGRIPRWILPGAHVLLVGCDLWSPFGGDIDDLGEPPCTLSPKTVTAEAFEVVTFTAERAQPMGWTLVAVVLDLESPPG